MKQLSNKIDLEKIMFVIILLWIVVYSIFAEKIPYGIFSLISSCIVIYCAVRIKKISFDFALLFLLLGLVTGVYYGFYFLGNADTVDINKALSPIIAYLLGQVIVYLSNDEERNVQAVYFCMAVPMFFYGIISAIYCRKTGMAGTYISVRNGLVDIQSVVLVEMLFLLMICAIPYGIINIRKNKVIAIPVLFSGIISIVAAVKLQGMFPVVSLRLKSYNMKEAIILLCKEPRKGFFITANGLDTSFNMWLDYARDYGIFGFAPLIIFKVISIYSLIRMLVNKKVSLKIKLLMAPAFIILNIFYSTEYLARNSIYLWIYGLIVCGMIRSISIRK